jgi:hypothetical protein
MGSAENRRGGLKPALRRQQFQQSRPRRCKFHVSASGHIARVTDRQHDVIILAMVFLLAALAGLVAGLGMEYF